MVSSIPCLKVYWDFQLVKRMIFSLEPSSRGSVGHILGHGDNGAASSHCCEQAVFIGSCARGHNAVGSRYLRRVSRRIGVKHGEGVGSIAIRGKFENEEPVSLKKVDDRYFLELYHGPTCAFKDMALTILPYLMTTAMKNADISKDIVILTATSAVCYYQP